MAFEPTTPENKHQPQGQTRDIAAKAAGFANGKTYEQAKRVTDEDARRKVSTVVSTVLSCFPLATTPTAPTNDHIKTTICPVLRQPFK